MFPLILTLGLVLMVPLTLGGRCKAVHRNEKSNNVEGKRIRRGKNPRPTSQKGRRKLKDYEREKTEVLDREG
jgi:hypothetical protein